VPISGGFSACRVVDGGAVLSHLPMKEEADVSTYSDVKVSKWQ
jgi:hypothetical protein